LSDNTWGQACPPSSVAFHFCPYRTHKEEHNI